MADGVAIATLVIAVIILAIVIAVIIIVISSALKVNDLVVKIERLLGV